MTPNPISISIKAKGPYALFQRASRIIGHYGLTSKQMMTALERFSDVLWQFDMGATFPITAVTLRRHQDTIANYLDQNLEFAVHGYLHVDYSRLAPEAQLIHLERARELFVRAGLAPTGYRSPYLRRDDQLYDAIEEAGFSYVSNQPILWDVLDTSNFTPPMQAGYQRALDFYVPWQASERLSLPRLNNELVEIPVSLPDDEILVDRLGSPATTIQNAWLQMLSKTHCRGELFTLQLHPERIAACIKGLFSVLSEARTLAPAVWCARLDEISTWWKGRAQTSVLVDRTEDGGFHCVICGPPGISVLVRGVEVDTPSIPWADGYREIKANQFIVYSPVKPFIGISPSAALNLAGFLRQEGYIVEISPEKDQYSCYLEKTIFNLSQERLVLDFLEKAGGPLIRLGRWPNGAKSALAITGDIDALTLWDYGLRFLGK